MTMDVNGNQIAGSRRPPSGEAITIAKTVAADYQDVLPLAYAIDAHLAAVKANASRDALVVAARAALDTRTMERRGGDEWAAGFVDGKNAAAQSILALAEDTTR